jgi:hypothetical protein
MKKFVFAALAVTAIIWGTGAFRPPPQNPLTAPGSWVLPLVAH